MSITLKIVFKVSWSYPSFDGKPSNEEFFVAAEDIKTVLKKYPQAQSIEKVGYFRGEL